MSDFDNLRHTLVVVGPLGSPGRASVERVACAQQPAARFRREEVGPVVRLGSPSPARGCAAAAAREESSPAMEPEVLVWQRSRTVRARGVRGGLLVCLALLAPGCGGTVGEVEAALAKLEAGEAETAEGELRALFDERPEDPVLAYDLARAHQERGRAREARARYADVLVRGDRKLRARAHTNLAMLAVDEVVDLSGDDPVAVPEERRAEIRDACERALDALQRARNLDGDLTEAVRRQDLLARWMRAVEDAWRAADRQAEKDERAGLAGAAFMAALIDAERGLIEELGSGDSLLEDVELRQRDLRAEWGDVPDRAAGEGGVAEAFREDVLGAVGAAPTACEEIEGLLRDGRVDAAAVAIAATAETWTVPLLLWAEPGDGLRRAAEGFGSFASGLQQLSALDRIEDEEALELGAAARTAAADRLGRLRPWLDALTRRLSPEQVDEAWDGGLVERTRVGLERASALAQRASGNLGRRGPQALMAVNRAAGILSSLALDWEIAGLDAAQIARRLESEQQRLTRAADSASPDVSLRGLASALAQRLAWPTTVEALSEQAARLGFVETALARTGAEGQPGADPDAQARAQAEAEALREAAAPRLETARQQLAAASAAASGGPSRAVVDASHAARVALRELGLLLSSELEAALERASAEQEALAATGESIGRRTDADIALDGALRDSVREQGVTAALVQGLDLAVDGESARAAEAPEGEDAAARAERTARLAVLDEVRAELGPAAEAATDALGALQVSGSAIELLNRAAPEQRVAADRVAEALRLLREAGLSLVELASRIVEGETGVVDAARALAQGQPVAGPSGQPLTWDDVRQGQFDAGSFAARLEAALERELAAAAAQSAEAPADDEARDRLRLLVDAVRASQAAAEVALQDEGSEAVADRAIPATESVLDAGRALWRELAEFQPLLERAVEEQEAHVAQSGAFAADDGEAAGLRALVGDQERTQRLIPPLTARVEAAAKQAAEAQQGTQDGAGSASAPGGLSEEVIELSRRNLPAADRAIEAALGHLASAPPAWNDALDQQEEAHRLLREILDQLEDEQDEQQQQNQPEPQQSPQPQQQQGGDSQQPLSREELQRLMQAVRERNDRRPEPRARTPVERDW